MSSFIVKSSVHDYRVEFIFDLKEVLERKINEGDFIILDKRINELYHDQIAPTLLKNKYICIDPNESLKSYLGVQWVIQALIESGFRKNNRLVAIGGGITQDVTAFISSIIYRGVSWIFFPTTLLAQGDSCIGSKTSINFGNYKNLLGGFYPPSEVMIYIDFLDTLSDVELRSGMGEMLHYFVASCEEDFNLFRLNYIRALTDKRILREVIYRSLQIKKSFIERDEFDKNVRQVFNYGHSFGHAIESLTNYEIPHGIAVSFGIDMANSLSLKMGFISNEIRDEIHEITQFICSGYTISNLNYEDLINVLKKDKKNEGNRLGLILNAGYGELFKNFVEPNEDFKLWLKSYFIERC